MLTESKAFAHLREALQLDVTKTYSYERADLVAVESPTDYRRGMAYAAEVIRTAAIAGVPEEKAE